MRRTPTIEHDGSADFEVLGEVTKHWSDAKTGQRFLRGVCTGVREDSDGERVSARAIARMAAKSLGGGGVLATASHDQEWWNEFGEVIALKQDTEHNELQVDVVLPPAGEDAIADKAYKRAQKGDLGWSIGGKLRKSFFELVPADVGKGAKPKRRHVLDDIDLRHVMLTKKPSYRESFAQAVAKTAKLDEATSYADEDLFDEADGLEERDAVDILKRATADLEATLAKAKAPPVDEDEDPDASAAADAPAADVDPDTDPDVSTPGSGDTSPQRTDAQAAADLPQGEAQRHLACPNCGTEFAAPLPDDLKPGEVAEKPDDEKPSADTAKTTNKEIPVAPTPLTDSLAAIRAAAGGVEVEKSTPEPTAPTVAKTDEEPTDIEKMIAAGHRLSVEKTEELGETVAEAFAGVQKSIQGLSDQLAELPVGRRSIAKRGGNGDPPPERQLDDEERTIAKVADDAPIGGLSREQLLTLSHDEISKRAESSTEAFKAINKRDRGIG